VTLPLPLAICYLARGVAIIRPSYSRPARESGPPGVETGQRRFQRVPPGAAARGCLLVGGALSAWIVQALEEKTGVEPATFPQ
jgi:hypothetical protein